MEKSVTRTVVNEQDTTFLTTYQQILLSKPNKLQKSKLEVQQIHLGPINQKYFHDRKYTTFPFVEGKDIIEIRNPIQ